MLPAGRRRKSLHERVEKQALPLFAGHVLPFDLGCTQPYSKLMAKARKAGLAISTAEGYIAAIAVANGFILAKPDTSSFEAAGADVINPWLA